MNILITGGCGFIGCNAADTLRNLGHRVDLLDDLSRPGATQNLDWLCRNNDYRFIHGDVRERELVAELVACTRYDVLIHLAAQVAVTTSVLEPRRDFEVNALGTLNVLEAVRLHSPETIVLNASTNKVYGQLSRLPVRERESRYELVGLPEGVSERQPLDFHSPYGCSKGAAEQYVVDYARIYGLRTVNFRQSCIYGCRQFGIEDQGWVAWFLIAHLLGKPITIYGNGKQVRDVLFVDELIQCYWNAIVRIDSVAGQSFNIGGGPDNTLSLLEFLQILEELSGHNVAYRFADWRAGDQPVYVSDVRQAGALLDWRPHTDVHQGVRRLHDWVSAHLELFEQTVCAGD